MDPSRTALRGILLALGGTAMLSVNDMAVKSLSGGYPLHQVVLVRGLVGFTVIGALLWWTGGRVRTRRPGLHLLRAVCVLLSNILYFLGLAALPMADGVAISYVAPLLITALSVPLLGEKVGPRRWAAVAVGLLGVLVMVRPGAAGVSPAALLVVGGALAYAAVNLLARHMGGTEGALTLSFWTQAAFVVTSAVVGLSIGDGRLAGSENPSLDFLLRAWTWPPLADWPVLLLTGLTVSVGGVMLAQAYRTCEAALVSPFEYVGMPLAILWGVVVFGQWPDALAWTGIALICGSGLYALWRETRVRGEPEARPGIGGGLDGG